MLGNVLAGVVALAALVVSLVRGRRDDLTGMREKIDNDFDAVVKQVRGLELEVAKNYVTRSEIKQQFDELGTRVDAAVTRLEGKIDALEIYLRTRSSR